MDGGMMMASDAAEDVTAAESGAPYPRFFMAGMRIEPIAATSATAEPEISAKNIETPIVTMASPPRMNPRIAETKPMRRWEMPVAFMIAPARTNIGMAMSENCPAPLYMSRPTEVTALRPSAAKMPI